MADLFQREDSHFLVFFDADKTVQLLPRQRIVFSVGDNVSVSFPTSTLKDDGTEDIQDIPYAGKVFFSGSASKCRGLKTRINEEVSPSSNSDFLETLQKLSKEVKSCGKRGASVKLKRAIEEESRDTSKKKNKKQKTNDESSKNASSGKEKAQSKPSSTKALKLKEMMAFAGVSSEYPSDSLLQARAGTSPSKCLATDVHLHNPTRSPQKSSTPPLILNTAADNTDTPTKAVLQKSRTKQKSTPVNNSDLCQTSESPQHPKKTSTSTNLQADTTENPPRTIPRKSPRKQKSSAASINSLDLHQNSESPQHPKKTSTSTNLQADTTENPPRATGILRKSPRKLKPTATPVNNLDLHQNSKSSNSPKKTSTLLNLQSEITDKPTSETQQNYGFGSETATSSLVSSSLNLLNSVAEDPEEVQFDEELTDFSDAYYSPEYGYNVNSSMVEAPGCRPPPPFQGLINYYNQLDHNAQVTVFGFLNVLVTELQGVTYGHSSSSDSTSTLMKAQQQSVNFQQQPTGESERKIPLLRDEHGTYDDILVNPSRLRQAESKALVAKSPAAYLLNKVLDLIFTEQELAASKGVRSLDVHKMEAVSEYIHAWTTKMNVDNLNAKSQTNLIQNKIGNLRFHRKKKAGAVLVSK